MENHSPKENISLCIKNYLETTNESYVKFAEVMGVTDTSVKRWAKGVCCPDIDLLPKLCDHICVSLNQLLGVNKTSDLSDNEVILLKEYVANISFKKLIDLYNSNPSFKEHIDYLVNLQK